MQYRSSMTRHFSEAPVWRIVLSWLALFFAAHRVGAAYLVYAQTESVSPLFLAGLQVAGALFLFVALRWYANLIVPALLVTGALLGGSALVGWGIGILPPVTAATQLLIAVLGTAGFAFLIRLGLQDDEHGRGREHDG